MGRLDASAELPTARPGQTFEFRFRKRGTRPPTDEQLAAAAEEEKVMKRRLVPRKFK
jgi:hypothetical protein